MDIDQTIEQLRGQGAPEATIQAFDKLVRPWMQMLDEGKANGTHPGELTGALADAVPLMLDLIIRMTCTNPDDMRAVWAAFQTRFRDSAETYSAATMLALATRKGRTQ